MNNKTKTRQFKGRMDFVQKIESFENNLDGSVKFKAILIPDPRRYDKLILEGKEVYKDRYTDLIIPIEVLKKACERVSIDNPLPIYSTIPKRNDPCNYLKEKKKDFQNQWDTEITIINSGKSTDALLKSLCGKETIFSILYVDLENSTELSYSLTPEVNEKIIKIFLNHMIQIIDIYRGYVLKISGDCVIGIFPSEVNAPNACDNSIQAAMTMRNMIEDVINPIFTSKDYPNVGYHIGIDIGDVKITNMGVKDIATFTDVIGYSMNLTSKIQTYAGHNEILIGKQLFSNIHCYWQERCSKKNLEGSWKLKDPCNDNKIYELYSVDVKWTCDL